MVVEGPMRALRNPLRHDEARERWVAPLTPSVDQISSRKGYGMSEVRLIVLIANVAMNG